MRLFFPPPPVQRHHRRNKAKLIWHWCDESNFKWQSFFHLWVKKSCNLCLITVSGFGFTFLRTFPSSIFMCSLESTPKSYPGSVIIGLRGPVIQLILLWIPIALHCHLHTVLQIQQVVCGNIFFRGRWKDKQLVLWHTHVMCVCRDSTAIQPQTKHTWLFLILSSCYF